MVRLVLSRRAQDCAWLSGRAPNERADGGVEQVVAIGVDDGGLGNRGDTRHPRVREMVVAVQPVAGPVAQDQPPEGLDAAVTGVAGVQASREVGRTFRVGAAPP